MSARNHLLNHKQRAMLLFKNKRELFYKYLTEICNQFELQVSELTEKTKKRYTSDARQMLWYLCKEKGLRIVDIIDLMEEIHYEVSHTTIIHGVKMIRSRVDEQESYRDFVAKITDIETESA
mgnify:CR=1 FL=1